MQRIVIITPALADANNGNWHTARRWAQALHGRFEVVLEKHWSGASADAMIALHARRSASSIAAFAGTGRPCALVLTGTDLYRDIQDNAEAQASLNTARHLVVLQDEGLTTLPKSVQHKTRVIYQSAPLKNPLPYRKKTFDWIMVGHIRAEKDPLTALNAFEMVRNLPHGLTHRLMVIGKVTEDPLGEAVRRHAAHDRRIHLLGMLGQTETRAHIARSRALLLPSLMEGGANVLIEAVRSEVPVLASRISGSLGMLGADYRGYFEVGNCSALAGLMMQFSENPDFAGLLREQCAARSLRFDPQIEAAQVRRLAQDLVQA
jgi:putative glycosyltransferase (TIGR04348 family)